MHTLKWINYNRDLVQAIYNYSELLRDKLHVFLHNFFGVQLHCILCSYIPSMLSVNKTTVQQ